MKAYFQERMFLNIRWLHMLRIWLSESEVTEHMLKMLPRWAYWSQPVLTKVGTFVL